MPATGKVKDVKRGRKVVVKALCFANYEFSSVLTGQPQNDEYSGFQIYHGIHEPK